MLNFFFQCIVHFFKAMMNILVHTVTRKECAKTSEDFPVNHSYMILRELLYCKYALTIQQAR